MSLEVWLKFPAGSNNTRGLHKFTVDTVEFYSSQRGMIQPTAVGTERDTAAIKGLKCFIVWFVVCVRASVIYRAWMLLLDEGSTENMFLGSDSQAGTHYLHVQLSFITLT